MTTKVIEPLDILNARYQIIKPLAQSQYRRTYLAKDHYRFGEFCVIKEFIYSESNSDRILQEAQFKQEAQILYQLNHPQIPRFRETFSLEQPEMGLYYVRDYIPGLTYRELLNLYLSQQRYFSETEILVLLKQLLPVVDYLHSLGVYHQDISLDNLLCRKWDQLPILIDFSQVQTLENNSPLLSPHQDLTQLAIVLLSLLTGKEPSELFDGKTNNWQDEIILNPKLKQVLGRMRAEQEVMRFTTAQDVMEFLEQPDEIENQPTIIVIPSPPPVAVSTPSQKETMVTLSRNKQGRILGCLSQLGLVLAVSLASGTMGWFYGKTWLKPPAQPTLTFENKDLPFSPDPALSPVSSEQAEEWQRKADLRKRRQELGINNQFFQLLVDQIFASRDPDNAVKATSADPLQRREGQVRRDEIATELLDQLSSLSEEARGELGSFDRTRRQEIIKEANDLNISSRALYDLANAEFTHQFPDENSDNIEQPTGQIVSALLLESLRKLQAEEVYEKISDSLTQSGINRLGSLEPGKGQIYIIQLEANQEVEFQLSASQETQLSIYSPSGRNNLLEDSTKTFWMGNLPDSGLYEIVIVSKSDSTFDYQFDVRMLSSGENQ